MAKRYWFFIARDVVRAIGTGRLRRGERLPTVREAADRLGLSVNTVRRAYRELEDAGWVEVRDRHGARILGRGTDAAHPPGAEDVKAAAAALGLRLNPRETAANLRRHGACTTFDEGLPAAALPRGERRWLGHAMRTSIRRARLAGLSYAEVEALFRAASAWEGYREAVRAPGWLRPGDRPPNRSQNP